MNVVLELLQRIICQKSAGTCCSPSASVIKTSLTPSAMKARALRGNIPNSRTSRVPGYGAAYLAQVLICLRCVRLLRRNLPNELADYTSELVGTIRRAQARSPADLLGIPQSEGHA